MKVIVNKSFGGAGLSEEAIDMIVDNPNFQYDLSEGTEGLLWKLKNLDGHYYRTNQVIINVIETLGEEANGNHANLVIAEIPDNVEWEVYNYDGLETIEAPRKVYA